MSNAMNMGLGKIWEMVRDREAWDAAVDGVAESDVAGQLNNTQMGMSASLDPIKWNVSFLFF